MLSRIQKTEIRKRAGDAAKADRTERLEIYKLLVEMADRVSQRRQAANSFYLSINSFIITASAYLDVKNVSVKQSVIICCAGTLISVLWTRAIESYKTLNENKFLVINALETQLVVQPYSDEWEKIDPRIHGKKHRPFHQTERLVPRVFIALFVLQGLSVLPWTQIVRNIGRLVHGGMN